MVETGMHILMLAGAHSVHTQRWANALIANGHRITLVTCDDHRPELESLDPRIAVEYLPYGSLRSLGYFLNAGACRRIVAATQPDVVSVHYASGYGTLSRRAKVKRTVLSVWGSDVYEFPDRSRLHRRLVVKNLEYAAALASTSPSMVKRVRHLLSDCEAPIAVTPFGVDLRDFQSLRSSQNSGGLILIGSIKGLKQIYGFQYLIEAASLIRGNGMLESTGFRIDIYGEGPQLIELQLQIAEYELQDLVHLRGPIPHAEVPMKLADMDIFVMPSLEESFGVAALEAMAAGVPVIVTDTYGPAEIVTDGVDGIVVPKGDSGRLAKAIVRLALDATQRGKMGTAGRQRVERDFDFADNVATLIVQLREVASSN